MVLIVRRACAMGPVLFKWLHSDVTILIYCFGVFQTKKQVGNIVVGVDSFITKQTIKPALEEIREKKEEGMKRRIEKEEEARKKREQKVKEKAEETRR
jgi:transposase